MRNCLGFFVERDIFNQSYNVCLKFLEVHFFMNLNDLKIDP
jgi:hypothetical protein